LCIYQEEEDEEWPQDTSYANVMLNGRLTAKGVTNDGRYLKSRYAFSMEDSTDISYRLVQNINGLMLGIRYNGQIVRRGIKRQECTDPGESGKNRKGSAHSLYMGRQLCCRISRGPHGTMEYTY
jgi:hypothetical protein